MSYFSPLERNGNLVRREPSWLVKSGSVLILVVLFGILIFSWAIKYPDVIVSQINIISTRQPLTVEARTSGVLSFTDIYDSLAAFPAQVLAIVNDETNEEDIRALRQYIGVVKSSRYKYNVAVQDNFVLDEELMSTLTAINLEIKRYELYMLHNSDQLAIRGLRTEIEYRKQLIVRRGRIWNNLNETQIIADHSSKRDSILFLQRVFSNVAYENSKKEYIVGQNLLEQAETELYTEQMAVAVLEHRIKELDVKISTSIRTFEDNIAVSLALIERKIANWEFTHIVKSPVRGNLYFCQLWEKQQSVKVGDKLFYIVPHDGGLFANTYVNAMGFGKVQIGQKVLIKLDNYPYQEFGIIQGRVSHISPIFTEKGYLVNVALGNRLVSSEGKQLNFTHQMKGRCEILTRDARLIERLIFPIRW